MRYSKEEKEMWLEDWRASGKSAYQYGKENGFVPWTFIRWTKEEAETKPSFVEVPLEGLRQPPQVAEMLIEKGVIRIHIPLGMDCNRLRAALEGLRVVL